MKNNEVIHGHAHRQRSLRDRSSGVMTGKQYNHAYTIAFSVVDEDPTGENVTAQSLRKALLARVASLSDDELIEAAGLPFDTYEETGDIHDINATEIGGAQ